MFNVSVLPPGTWLLREPCVRMFNSVISMANLWRVNKARDHSPGRFALVETFQGSKNDPLAGNDPNSQYLFG